MNGDVRLGGGEVAVLLACFAEEEKASSKSVAAAARTSQPARRATIPDIHGRPRRGTALSAYCFRVLADFSPSDGQTAGQQCSKDPPWRVVPAGDRLAALAAQQQLVQLARSQLTVYIRQRRVIVLVSLFTTPSVSVLRSQELPISEDGQTRER